MESVPPSGPSLMLHFNQVGHVVYWRINTRWYKYKYISLNIYKIFNNFKRGYLQHSYACPWCSPPAWECHERQPDPSTAAVCSCWTQGCQRTEQTAAAAEAPGRVELRETHVCFCEEVLIDLHGDQHLFLSTMASCTCIDQSRDFWSDHPQF